MKNCNLLTNIKNQVQQKNQRIYKKHKQKNSQKYYELFLPKIITIQNQWRKFLVKKNNKLQNCTINQLKIYIKGKQKNQQLKNKLSLLMKQKLIIKSSDNLDRKFQLYKYQLQNQVQKSIANVIQNADKYAKIQAVIKNQIQIFKQITKINHNLKKQTQNIKESLLQYKKQNSKLNNKIVALRKVISLERAEIQMIKGEESFQAQSVDRFTHNQLILKS